MSQGQGGGRPRRWTSEAELADLVEAYFVQFDDGDSEDSPKAKKAPNLFGLCRYTQMSYDAFVDYESGSMDTETEKFSVSLKDSRMRCLEYAAEHSFTHTAGAVFNQVNLTRKFKEPWKNAQHQEVSSPGKDTLDMKMTVEFVKGPKQDEDTAS